MSDLLVAVANGRKMGEVHYQTNRLAFRYATEWQANPEAFPISLSMPLVSAEHGHRTVEAFLWGLLPDNDGVLERWGRRFQVSPSNPFRLLEHVGEDCAGAVQFVRPERVDEIMAAGDSPVVQWLNDQEMDLRIRTVIEDASATRLGGDAGQFSLAGAQPKTALYFDQRNNRWGVPEGRTPTTHILKPATGVFDGHVENEHFCLQLAASLGFPTAQSSVKHWAGVPVIVLERFDRLEREGVIRRIHQEDFCQAAGIRPQIKYQNQGGPSPKQIGEILRTCSSAPEEDSIRFADALIFSWLTSGTDAHAKNYAMLIAGEGGARLAPLYDLASALPYPQQIQPRKASLAMKIGSHYKVQQIRRADWEKLARDLRLHPGELINRIGAMADQLQTASSAVATLVAKEGIDHPVVPRLAEEVRANAKERLDKWNSPVSDASG